MNRHQTLLRYGTVRCHSYRQHKDDVNKDLQINQDSWHLYASFRHNISQVQVISTKVIFLTNPKIIV